MFHPHHKPNPCTFFITITGLDFWSECSEGDIERNRLEIPIIIKQSLRGGFAFRMRVHGAKRWRLVGK